MHYSEDLTVTKKKVNWATRLTLSAVSIAIIVLGVVFLGQLLINWIGISLVIISSGWAVIYVIRHGGQLVFWFRSFRQKDRENEARTKIVEYEALKAEEEWKQEQLNTQHHVLSLPIVETNQGLFKYNIEGLPEATYFPKTVSERKELEKQMLLEAPKPDLMDRIEYEDCLVSIGPRGSGKTNTALNWLESKDADGIIVDAKGLALNNWPRKYEVVSDPDLVQNALDRAMSELEKYRRASMMRQKPYILFIDELKYLEQVTGKELLIPVMNIAMLGRAYNIHSGFTSHVTTVAHLKIEGAALLDNFCIVENRCENKKKGIFKCFIDEVEYNPAPQFPEPEIPIGLIEAYDEGPVEEPKSEESLRALQLLQEGKSASHICDQIYGEGRRNKHYKDKLAEMLMRDWGVKL